MAQLLSAYARAKFNSRGASTIGFPNAAGVQRTRKTARDTYTTVGTEANNDTILVDFPLPIGSIVDVENCKLRFGASGTFSASVTLQRVTAAGVATSLSAALATTSAAVGTFAAAAITPPTPSGAGDYLQLLITPFTSATAGKVIAMEIAFDAPLI